MRRTAAAAAVSILVALLAPLAAGAAPTRAEFIRKGDAICRDVQRELAPLRRQAEAAKSLPEAQQWAAVTKVWTAQVKIQARFNVRFDALGVPAGDAAATKLVSSLHRGLAIARRIRDAFSVRDTETLGEALPTYLRFTLSLNRRVRAYGFKACGR